MTQCIIIEPAKSVALGEPDDVQDTNRIMTDDCADPEMAAPHVALSIDEEESLTMHHELLLSPPSIGKGSKRIDEESVTIHHGLLSPISMDEELKALHPAEFKLSSPPPAQQSKMQIWKARAFLLLCAILYGTSFPLIKILGDTSMPVGMSLTIRFGLAALVTFPWLIEAPAIDWTTSYHATLSGMEIGVWNIIGFLSQAMGLMTEKSNKVRLLIYTIRSSTLCCGWFMGS